MIELNFRLEAQDLAGFFRESMYAGPSGEALRATEKQARRSIRNIYTMHAVMFGSAALLLLIKGVGLVMVGLLASYAAVQVWVCIASGSAKQRKAVVEKYLGTLVRSGAYDAYRQMCRYTLSEHGISAESGDVSSSFNWRYVSSVDQTSEHVGVHLVNGTVMVFPNREIEAALPASQFAAQLREWLAMHGRSDAESLSLFLAERDVSCLKCGYNLRALVGASCPECGEILSVSALRQAAAAGDGHKRR